MKIRFLLKCLFKDYMTTLKKHREWLENYKTIVKTKKEDQNVIEALEQEKFQKVWIFQFIFKNKRKIFQSYTISFINFCSIF
jgi:hypothetical protein